MKRVSLPRDPERAPLLPRTPAFSRSASGVGPSKEELGKCNVFGTILMIRELVIEHVDAPLTWQKLMEPEVTYSIVRPLTDKLVALENLAVVYCILANRLQFLDDSHALPHARLNTTRAALCEIIAIRVLTHYAKPTQPDLAFRRTPTLSISIDPVRAAASSIGGALGAGGGLPNVRQRRMSMAEPASVRMAKKRQDELVLANVLIAPFSPFAGAPKEVLEEEELEGRKGMGKACNALELAIVTEAKNFISCVSCQKVLGSVYSGRIYYAPSAFLDLLPDHRYKQKPITLYDPRRAPLLDHYRLRVPRYRMVLEFVSFAIVFGLMMMVMSTKELDRMNVWEAVFIIYTCGWALDRFATTLEHGWRVFAANLWNGIDAAIIVLFMLYLPFRLLGLLTGNTLVNDYALSVLSCESALLFPRLAFFFLAGNVLVMSLRAMLSQFLILMFAAVFIFVGFWHALYTLDEGNYGVWEIAKYMVNIWFGLDSTGFDISTNFHPYLGPVIFFVFACLANTLFITVVVAILSTTFAELNADAKAEFMFRDAVGIIEGVKGDALFSFQPPLNLLALFILFPLNYCLSPRAFHKIHVFLTRLANAPILAIITLFERARHATRIHNVAERIQRALPKRMQEISLLMSGAHADIEAVFDYAPDAKLLAADRAVDEWAQDEDAEQEAGGNTASPVSTSGKNREEISGMSRASGVNGLIRGLGGHEGREEIEADETEFESVVGSLPITGTSIPRREGILSTSPVTRTRSIGGAQHLTFEPGRSFSGGTGGHVPPPRRSMSVTEREHQSPLEKLYARENTFDVGTRNGHSGGGAGARGDTRDEVPSWVLELNATLRGIEMRQRKIETVLNGLNDLANQGEEEAEGGGGGDDDDVDDP